MDVHPPSNPLSSKDLDPFPCRKPLMRYRKTAKHLVVGGFRSQSDKYGSIEIIGP